MFHFCPVFVPKTPGSQSGSGLTPKVNHLQAGSNPTTGKFIMQIHSYLLEKFCYQTNKLK